MIGITRKHAVRGLLLAGCLAIATVVPPNTARARSTTPAFPFRVTDLRQVAQLIGPTRGDVAGGSASINDTRRWGVCGGDLGSLIVSQGTAYIALGDNYATCPPGTGGPADNLAPPDWRSNALAVVAKPADFSHGLHITGWYGTDGKHAAEVIPSDHNAGDCQNVEMLDCEVTAIPTYGFATQNHLFLAYMSVHHWGAAAQWDVNYSSLAMSADRGKTWTVERNKVQWGPTSNFAQVAVTADPDGSHLLFYGIPGGRFGSVKLMRVANSWQSVLSSKAYQYYAGTNAAGQPIWSADSRKAVTVAAAPVGELSVIYDAGLKQWLMTYLQGGNDDIMPSSDDLVIRSAAHYWGPWSAPATLVSHTQNPGIYGAFMHQQFLADGGKTVYFVMSRWGPYSIYWMRATLLPLVAPAH